MGIELPLARFFSLGVKNVATKSFLVPSYPIKTCFRTGYILKRRVPIPEYSRLESADSKMRNLDPIHEEYEMIENSNYTLLPEIEVILKAYVEDVGQPGQKVFLDQNFAYELIILGNAMYVTPENLAKIKILSESDVAKHSSLSAFKTSNMLKKQTLSVYMNMQEPWTIEPWHIRVNFRLAGVHVLSDDCIELPKTLISGPNMDFEGKDFVIHVTINNCERIPVRCRLHHYTKVFSLKVNLPPDHECTPSDAILPEQADLLKSIPLPDYVDQSTTKRVGQLKRPWE